MSTITDMGKPTPDATAEVERLRSALDEIANGERYSRPDTPEHGMPVTDPRSIARAALAASLRAQQPTADVGEAHDADLIMRTERAAFRHGIEAGLAHTTEDRATDNIVREVTEGFAADVERIMGDEPEASVSDDMVERAFAEHVAILIEIDGEDNVEAEPAEEVAVNRARMRRILEAALATPAPRGQAAQSGAGVRDVLSGTLAALCGAWSLAQRLHDELPKSKRDALWSTRVKDYEKAIEVGRAALATPDPRGQAAQPGAADGDAA